MPPAQPSPPQNPQKVPDATPGGLPEASLKPQPVFGKPRQSHTRLLIVLLVVLLIGAAAAAWWLTVGSEQIKKDSTAPIQQTTQQSTKTTTVEGLQLDTTKSYGNKYADGVLPVGDSMYATSAAKKGYVYTCNANFVPASQAGAQTRGPWFVNNNTQWDSKKKSAIAGSVTWQQKVSITASGDTRTITTNDLPDHHTGVFPVAANDPARMYDANPNTISEQSLVYALTANPTYGTPQCMGGEAGIMVNGVALFNAFDAGGRDAGAWEVQDTCDGHPQNKGEYHYHTLSRCIADTSVETVIGFALDGFPITGPKVREGNILTTSDLDECHGITSHIIMDGKKITSYHYVMTQDFPYSVSCFRAKAIQPPGQHETAGGGQQTAPPDQQQPPAKP